MLIWLLSFTEEWWLRKVYPVCNQSILIHIRSDLKYAWDKHWNYLAKCINCIWFDCDILIDWLGSHSELLMDPDGAYSQLIRLQEVNEKSEQAVDVYKRTDKAFLLGLRSWSSRAFLFGLRSWWSISLSEFIAKRDIFFFILKTEVLCFFLWVMDFDDG